jgi:hypothetical protein
LNKIGLFRLLKLWKDESLTGDEINILWTIYVNKSFVINKMVKEGKIDKKTIDKLIEKDYIIGENTTINSHILNIEVHNIFKKYELSYNNNGSYVKPTSSVQKKPASSNKMLIKRIASIIEKHYPQYVKYPGNSEYTTIHSPKEFLEKRLTLLIKKYPGFKEILDKAETNDIIDSIRLHTRTSNKIANGYARPAMSFVYHLKNEDSPLISGIQSRMNKRETFSNRKKENIVYNDGILDI